MGQKHVYKAQTVDQMEKRKKKKKRDKELPQTSRKGEEHARPIFGKKKRTLR